MRPVGDSFMSSNDPAVAARSQASFALALLPAAIAHAALILAFANVIEAEIGTGGSVVEAIGVTLAESTVLASREAAPVAKVALSAPEAPAPPPSEVAAAARPADPPSPDLAPVLATHEPALTEIAVAPRPEPRPREIEIPREPVNTSAAAEPTPAEATAMAAAVSIVAEPVSIPVKSAAAASPGEMAAYQRSIVLALSESAP